jgi:diketogulonate reductase-like aldo/keto reductase
VKQRQWGATGSSVGVIGQGTWYFERASRASAIAALRRGLDLGMNHIDTAEIYGAGVAEEITGEAIAGRRDEVFLVSKVRPDNASRSGTKAACERSLNRLKTDRLDCYLLHWRGPHPLADTISAFEELVREGKIRSWGVSNFAAKDLDEALSIAGKGHISSNQVLYHLQARGIEHATLQWCEKNTVTVTGYSPFGHDRFPSPNSAGGRVLADVAAECGATPRQVALAFLTVDPVTVTIPKHSSVAHAEENAAAGDLELSQEAIAKIDAAFPRGS